MRLCQHGQLVNANVSRLYSIAPLVSRDIEVRGSGTGGDGSGNEIIVARIEQHHGLTQFAARRLMKLDPNQDDFTRVEASWISDS